MKKLTFLIPILSFFLLSNSLSNEKSESSLNLSLYNGDNFTVSFNDKVTKEAVDEIEFNDLEAGKYYLKVVIETSGIKSEQEILFSDYVEIPSGCKIFAVIDETGKFYVYKKINNYLVYYKNHRRICYCDCEYCRNCNYKSNKENRQEKDEDCNNKTMKEKDFKEAIKAISETSFEVPKIEMAKQLLDQNILTSEQLKALLLTFSFEDSKVNIAEYGYDKTCDKKNFSRIYDVFSFESNIQLVKNYVSKRN